jgi:transcriptional regulator with XRE-family HTH domain
MFIDTIIDQSSVDCQALLVEHLRMESFGAVIRREREARGWSQQRLANAAGMNRSHVTAIELGKIGMPRLETVQALARAFGLLPNQIIEPTGRTVMDMLPHDVGDVEVDELLDLYNVLTDDDRERLIVIARALYQREHSR